MSKETAYVIIHGIAGGRFEVDYLKDYLNERGLISYSVKIEGHEGSKRELRNSTYKNWIKSVYTEVKKIKANHGDIVLIGFSMGGLIATNIMQSIKVKAVVYVNTPIYFFDFNNISKNIISDVKLRRFGNLKHYVSASKKMPVNAMINFLTILSTTKRLFCKVKADALIVMCLDDDTVKSKSARFIYDNIASKNKDIKYLEKGGHLVFMSDYRQNATEVVYEYLLSLSLSERH